jgi:hypothetical protein
VAGAKEKPDGFGAQRQETANALILIIFRWTTGAFPRICLKFFGSFIKE